MTHRKEFVPNAHVSPLGAEHPRARLDAGIHGMTAGRMGPLAIVRFLTATRWTHRHDLGLLSGEPFSVGIEQHNAPAGKGFFGLDRFHKHDATQGSFHDPK